MGMEKTQTQTAQKWITPLSQTRSQFHFNQQQSLFVWRFSQ